MVSPSKNDLCLTQMRKMEEVQTERQRARDRSERRHRKKGEDKKGEQIGERDSWT